MGPGGVVLTLVSCDTFDVGRCGLRGERVGPLVSGSVVLKLNLFVFAAFHRMAERHTTRYNVGTAVCPRVAMRVLRDRGGLEGRAVETRRVQ